MKDEGMRELVQAGAFVINLCHMILRERLDPDRTEVMVLSGRIVRLDGDAARHFERVLADRISADARYFARDFAPGTVVTRTDGGAGDLPVG